eukprot:m.74222 g.74222  ORF g.74222 m.74222 type:complete len:68 (-) comp20410_c0_seq2:219-422(-)
MLSGFDNDRNYDDAEDDNDDQSNDKLVLNTLPPRLPSHFSCPSSKSQCIVHQIFCLQFQCFKPIPTI